MMDSLTITPTEEVFVQIDVVVNANDIVDIDQAVTTIEFALNRSFEVETAGIF